MPYVYNGYFIIEYLISNYNTSIKELLELYKIYKNSFEVIKSISNLNIKEFLYEFYNSYIELIPQKNLISKLYFGGAIYPSRDTLILSKNLNLFKIDNFNSYIHKLNKNQLYIIESNITVESSEFKEEINYKLKEGWNLISLPFNTSCTLELECFIYDGSWILNPKVIPLGRGFWIKNSSNREVTFNSVLTETL